MKTFQIFICSVIMTSVLLVILSCFKDPSLLEGGYFVYVFGMILLSISIPVLLLSYIIGKIGVTLRNKSYSTRFSLITLVLVTFSLAAAGMFGFHAMDYWFNYHPHGFDFYERMLINSPIVFILTLIVPLFVQLFIVDKHSSKTQNTTEN